MFLIMFLLIGGFFIISNEKIKLDSRENIDYFFKLYSKWIDKLVGNSKTVSGYVVKMEWLPNEGKVSE